jgi:Fe-S-cluster-containing hydrogenase component 2
LLIDCKEPIPCDPCKDFCKHGAIKKKDLITPPESFDNLCIGCAFCVALCPGQAIFLIKEEGDESLIYIPFEFLPRPKKGEKVTLLDNEGREMGEGVVERLISPLSFDHTVVLALKVSSSIAESVRAIRL